MQPSIFTCLNDIFDEYISTISKKYGINKTELQELFNQCTNKHMILPNFKEEKEVEEKEVEKEDLAEEEKQIQKEYLSMLGKWTVLKTKVSF